MSSGILRRAAEARTVVVHRRFFYPLGLDAREWFERKYSERGRA